MLVVNGSKPCSRCGCHHNSSGRYCRSCHAAYMRCWRKTLIKLKLRPHVAAELNSYSQEKNVSRQTVAAEAIEAYLFGEVAR